MKLEYINKKEWEKLREINIDDNEDYEYWDLRNNLDVHYVINQLFCKDESLRRFLYQENWEKKRVIDMEAFKIDGCFRDHDYTVKIKSQFNEEFGVNLEGVMTFPYIFFEDFEKLQESLGREWEAYIINPALMRYASAVGVFITRNIRYEDNVSQINGYCKNKTGYDLFYNYTTDEIDEIKAEFKELNFKGFRKLFTGGEYPLMFDELINFWHDNDEIHCETFDNMYKMYSNGMSFAWWDGINFNSLESTIPFRFINHRTGWSSEELYYFEFDMPFNCAYTGLRKEIKFSGDDLKDLKKGQYGFDIVKDEEEN